MAILKLIQIFGSTFSFNLCVRVGSKFKTFLELLFNRSFLRYSVIFEFDFKKLDSSTLD